MLPLILSSTQLNRTTLTHLHSRIIKTKKMQRLLELLSKNRT